ncbi:MAG: SurA N-terminal domain-containing protein [Deltaproteobacteria bacterium]|nr:SurA N-terminal domain-containing protein [Deltaproteobacteria bacterium]
MLDVLRRNAGSWAIKIILGFIAITFIWWGVGTYSERGRDVAATVGDRIISVGELSEAVAGLEKTYRDVYGSTYTPEMAKALNFRKQALDTLIQRTILLSEAKKLGLAASDTEVQREIAASPAFQVNGQFDEERYRGILAYNRIPAADFEASKRQEITLKKMEGLLSAGARVPESEARELFDMTSRRVRLLVVAADPEKAGTFAAPTEGEISARYEQTKESFRMPARVKLLLARFEPGLFARDVSPTEKEINEFHERNADRFRTEEQRLVSQIFLPYSGKDKDAVMKKAAEISVEAGKGKAEFEKLAKKVSRGRAGETWMRRSEARPEVVDALFSAPVDSLAGPIDVEGGFLLLRVNRIRFPENLPLSQVKERIIALLRIERGKDIAVIKAYEAHARASASKDVKTACAPYGVKPIETGWTGEVNGEPVPSGLANEALLLPVGEIGPVQTIGDVHYLFQVVAKEESRIPALSQVRDKIVGALVKEKKRTAARAVLSRVLAGTETAAGLEKNARTAGLSVKTTGFFLPLSDSVPEGIPASGDIRKGILTLSGKAPVYPKVIEAPGKFLALALVGEQRADDREWAAGKAAFLQGMAEQKRSRVIEAFLSERRAKVKVEINPEVLK